MLMNPIIKFLGCLFFCIQSPKFFRSSLVSSFLVLLLDFFLSYDSLVWLHWSCVHFVTVFPLVSFMVFFCCSGVPWCINFFWGRGSVRGYFVALNMFIFLFGVLIFVSFWFV